MQMHHCDSSAILDMPATMMSIFVKIQLGWSMIVISFHWSDFLLPIGLNRYAKVWATERFSQVESYLDEV